VTKSRTLALLTVLMLGAAAGQLLVGHRAASAASRKPAIDPDADKLLHEMSNYLASLQSFKVESSAVDEVVTTAGQKIQILTDSEVTVERPNQLRSEQIGAGKGMGFWYDGTNMTLICKETSTYSTLPAPATIDATIDKARKDFQIEAPGADLLYSNPYPILTEQVQSGKLIGKEVVNGVTANHLAFRGQEVDWQIWITEGPSPLPVRFVIVSKTVKSQPQFAINLTNWEPRADVSPETFVFKAPDGANKVKTFPTSCGLPGGPHGKGQQ